MEQKGERERVTNIPVSPKSSLRQNYEKKSDVKQKSTESYQWRLIIIFANLEHIVPSCKARKHAYYCEDANNRLTR